MRPLAELIDEHDKASFGRVPPRKPARVLLEKQVTSSSTDQTKLYEVEVFNFLISNTEPLDISKVFQLKNSSADGEVELKNGRRVLVEIKYRMNWDKACQAGWQLLESLKLEPRTPMPYAGLVFFKTFSADWARKGAGRPLENGWYYWYAGHHKLENDFSAVLIRLEDGVWETYPELQRKLAASGPMG